MLLGIQKDFAFVLNAMILEILSLLCIYTFSTTTTTHLHTHTHTNTYTI